jgi:hypothetical protein
MGKIEAFLRTVDQVLSGYFNLFFKNTRVEIISRARMTVCNNCPYMDKKGSTCMVPGTQPCCSRCGCNLEAKTRSLESSCPEKKWIAIGGSDPRHNMILGV